MTITPASSLWLTTTITTSQQAMDFITDLPPSKGFDSILTVVDQFTKMSHFLPCVKSISSQETVDIVMREVFLHHGLPDDIITDREAPMGRPQNLLQTLFGLSSTNRWTNRAHKSNARAISSMLHQLSTR